MAAIKEINNAEDIDRAQVAIKAFEVDYGAKYPKAVAKIVDDADVFSEPNNCSISVYGSVVSVGMPSSVAAMSVVVLQHLSTWMSLSWAPARLT